MKKYIGLLFFVAASFIGSNAQSLDHTKFEDIISNGIKKAYPASVRIFGFDTVTQRQNSSQFSGVVVSPEGHILTVAHAIKPGAFYKVTFPDGQEIFAEGLGRLVTDSQTTRPDVAMMKLVNDGPWPYAEMGSSSSLAENQPCFGISYPESLGLLEPMLRFGRIISPMDQWGFIQSSCIMETGDSGGPLFDMQGRVVALHSRISMAEGPNLEVPVDLYQKYWTALNVAVNYDSLPMIQDSIILKTSPHGLISDNAIADLDVLIPVDIKKSVFGTVIDISSTINSTTKLIKGTIFNIGNGRQIIVSKSSCIGNEPSTVINGQDIDLHIIHRDKGSDLVALEATVHFPNSIELDGLVPTDRDDGKIGRILFSPLGNSTTSVGILGMELDYLPPRFSSGSFGASLREVEGYPTVVRISPGEPAAESGLAVGDKFFSINTRKVASAEDFNIEMMNYYPGDTIMAGVMRGQDMLRKSMVLIPRVHREQNHLMNQFDGGKSIRRDGFEHVFLHDSRIHSYDCGSPVFDSEGRFVGFNISRFSHVVCVALKSSVVRDFIETIDYER